VPADDLPRLLELRVEVVGAIKRAGYAYATMDLLGFRSGSGNEVLTDQQTRAADVDREPGR